MYVHPSSIYYYFLWLEKSRNGVVGLLFPYPAIGITCSSNNVELRPDLQLSPRAITASLLNFTAAAMFCMTNTRDILSVFLDVAVLEKCALNLVESIN